MVDLGKLDLNMEGNILREKWKNTGFADDFNRIKNDFDVSPELIRNVIHIGVAHGVEDAFSDYEEEWGHSSLSPFNVRAIEVFGHVWQEYGDEAFDTWIENPGYDDSQTFGDVDMYFPAGREIKAESRPNIEEVYTNRLGKNIEEALNSDNNQGEKYTAHFDFADDMEVEIDLIRPDVNSDSEYPMAQEDPELIETPGGAEMSVPPLEESIRHKGTLEFDNGEGHDTMRDKDYKELATLIDVAESRGNTAKDFEELYDDEDLYNIGRRAGSFEEKVAEEWPYQPSEEMVSRMQKWQHIYNL